jgi:hypothetical protein
MRVSLKDLREAFEFVCASGGEEHQAFLCKQSGKFYYHSELGDDLDSLPDDIDDGEKFLPIPDKRELDLGKPLALNFARQFLPGDFDEVRQFFSQRGFSTNALPMPRRIVTRNVPTRRCGRFSRKSVPSSCHYAVALTASMR